MEYYLYHPKWNGNREREVKDRIEIEVGMATDGEISEYGNMLSPQTMNGFRAQKSMSPDELRNKQLKAHIGKVVNLKHPVTGVDIKTAKDLIESTAGLFLLKTELADAIIDASTLGEGLAKNS